MGRIVISNLVLCGLLGRIDQRRQYNQAKKKYMKKMKNKRTFAERRSICRVQWYADCYTQKRLRELLVVGWSSTINDVLLVIFGYFLKLEEQKVLVARRTLFFVIFKVEICTCVGCQSMFSKGRQKLSTGKGILEDSQFLHLKDTSRTLASRRF